jgi:hypothetical protein
MRHVSALRFCRVLIHSRLGAPNARELGDCSPHSAFLACIWECKRLCVHCDGVPFVEREVVLTIRTRRLAGATTLQTDVFLRAVQACAWRQALE